jgi:hypothetical protein
MTPQVPSAAPAAFVHLPPQHSMSVAQASPVWVQNEAAAPQMPFWQRPEQQVCVPASPPVHGLPDVRQVVERGVQVPPPHLPPQHCASVVQAAPSAVHWAVEHEPFTHANVQHSVLALQAAPEAVQFLAAAVQVFVVGSQSFDWQSVFAVHAVPPGDWPMPVPVPPGPPGPPGPPSSVAPPSLPAVSSAWSLPHPWIECIAKPSPTMTAAVRIFCMSLLKHVHCLNGSRLFGFV